MMKSVFILTLCWPVLMAGQQVFYLDSLFCMDFGELEFYKTMAIEERIEDLQRDAGLSAGVRIANFRQDEIDQGLSTRIYGRINFWKGGMLDHQMEAEKLRNRMTLTELEGDQEIINHQYGIIYDAVLYLNNKKKLVICHELLRQCNETLNSLNELYYNKRIDFRPIIEVQAIQREYNHLMRSMREFNDLFEAATDMNLELDFDNRFWRINFEAIVERVRNNPEDEVILGMKNKVIELEKERTSLPNLSLQAGYDISRSQPYFSVNLSRDLWSSQNKASRYEQKVIIERHEMEKTQKQKELITYQSEYEYKIKQFLRQLAQLRTIAEARRKLETKSELLSIGKSVELSRLRIDSLLNEFEIQEIKQQSHLIILAVKKLIHREDIYPYLEHLPSNGPINKYKMERYLPIADLTALSIQDHLFLEQNEITPVSNEEFKMMDNVLAFNPGNYKNRSDLENMVEKFEDQGKDQKLFFTDLNALKELEIRTVNHHSNKQIQIQ